MKVNKEDKGKVVTSTWPFFKPQKQTLYGATTDRGREFKVWKANPIAYADSKKQLNKGIDTRYACYGFAVGSYKLQGGPYTPYASGIDLILEDEFEAISLPDLREDDLIIWRDEECDICHAAKVSKVYRNNKGELLDKTRLATKNGAGVLRDHMRLATLIIKYGNEMSFYREITLNLMPL